MQHGCNRRCPKVREQLRKAREKAPKETDDEISTTSSILSSVADPSKDRNEFTKRSKQSAKTPISSPKTVKSPQKSQQSLPKGSPNISQNFFPEKKSHRSKESQRTKGYPEETAGPSREFFTDEKTPPKSKKTQQSQKHLFDRESPKKSADSSRKFDAEERSNGEIKKKKGAIPKSRNGRKAPNEYESGSSSESDERRIPDYISHLRKAETGKSREFYKYEKAGPSRKKPNRTEEIDSDLYLDCEPQCLGRRRTRKAKEKEEECDKYFLYKNFSYFENLCDCRYECLIKQLFNDPFVKRTAASVAVFALGLKLCWELDGWTWPNTF